MDRFPASYDGPEYELQAIGRSLADLPPRRELQASRPGEELRPLLIAGAALAALIAFVGWLLVAAPSAPPTPTHAASVSQTG